MKVFIRQLGCKMNWLDSVRTATALQGAGHVVVEQESEADIVLVNSCTVTAEADRKSRQQAKSALRGCGQVAVTGCGPRVEPLRWQKEIPQAAILPAEEELFRFFGAETLAEEGAIDTGHRTRLPVAIQTGCDNRCTFCITRVARGAHHTVSAERVVAQIHAAEAAGVKEVVLTGINLAAWGAEDSNTSGQARLHELLATVLARTSIPRIRLSSLGPQYLHPAFFEVFADPRLCAYLHLSVQSGSETVLARMDRGHGVEEVHRIAEQARRARPDVAIATDLIVGFPGETAEEFAETESFVQAIGFAKLHVFPYSPRAGTPAAEQSDSVTPQEKKRRAAALRAAGRELRERFRVAQYGRRVQILVERGGTGLSGNYLRLKAPTDAKAGDLVRVDVTPERLAEG